VDEPVRDGFEGIGYLVEIFVPIAAVALAFPLVTVWLKLRKANYVGLLGGRYIWAFLVSYCLSLLSAWRFVPLSLTDKVMPTAIFACAGTSFAMVSLAFAFRSQGSGRRSAIGGAIFLTILWLPFFYGRVLVQLWAL
jgi:hypothetical protein